MYILGIDPGELTGFCMLNVRQGVDLLTRPVGAQVDSKHLHNMVHSWIGEADVIVVESEVRHGRLTEGKIAQLKVIGVIEYVTRRFGKDIIWITPEERKNSKIEAPDTASVPRPHAQDAYQLIIAYGIREGLIILDEANTPVTA